MELAVSLGADLVDPLVPVLGLHVPLGEHPTDLHRTRHQITMGVEGEGVPRLRRVRVRVVVGVVADQDLLGVGLAEAELQLHLGQRVHEQPHPVLQRNLGADQLGREALHRGRRLATRDPAFAALVVDDLFALASRRGLLAVGLGLVLPVLHRLLDLDDDVVQHLHVRVEGHRLVLVEHLADDRVVARGPVSVPTTQRLVRRRRDLLDERAVGTQIDPRDRARIGAGIGAWIGRRIATVTAASGDQEGTGRGEGEKEKLAAVHVEPPDGSTRLGGSWDALVWMSGAVECGWGWSVG